MYSIIFFIIDVVISDYIGTLIILLLTATMIALLEKPKDTKKFKHPYRLAFIMSFPLSLLAYLF